MKNCTTISRYFVSEGENFDFSGPYDSEDDGIADCPGAEYVRIIKVKAPEGVEIEVDYWEQDVDLEGERGV